MSVGLGSAGSGSGDIYHAGGVLEHRLIARVYSMLPSLIVTVVADPQFAWNGRTYFIITRLRKFESLSSFIWTYAGAGSTNTSSP